MQLDPTKKNTRKKTIKPTKNPTLLKKCHEVKSKVSSTCAVNCEFVFHETKWTATKKGLEKRDE